MRNVCQEEFSKNRSFAEFYEKQNGIPMNEIEKQILRTVLGEMEEMKGDTN